MRFERVWAVLPTRRVRLEAWATKQRPWCEFRIDLPQLWIAEGVSMSCGLSVCGIGFNLSTYYRATR
jgi:hypothetical protein